MIYIEDGFFEHPKVIKAGDEAALLFLRSLAWLKQQRSTDGRIPKVVLHRITPVLGGRPAASAKLATRLVDANLWHDDGDHWTVHGYVERNAKAIATSEARRKAALKRHHRDGAGGPEPPPEPEHKQSTSTSKPDASAGANAHANAGANADLPAHATGHRAQGTGHRAQGTGHASSSSPGSSREAAPPADDDDLDETWTLLARRRLDAQRADPNAPKIARPGPWLRSTATDLAAEHCDRARQLRRQHPDATPDQLADLLEPPDDQPTGPRTMTAAQAIALLDTQPDTPRRPPPPPLNGHPRSGP